MVYLWLKFKKRLSEDYLLEHSPEIAYNKTLSYIQNTLVDSSESCLNFYLPMPIDYPSFDNSPVLNIVEERLLAKNLYDKLNKDQKSIFDHLLLLCAQSESQTKCIYLDGPGGNTLLIN